MEMRGAANAVVSSTLVPGMIKPDGAAISNDFVAHDIGEGSVGDSADDEASSTTSISARLMNLECKLDHVLCACVKLLPHQPFVRSGDGGGAQHGERQDPPFRCDEQHCERQDLPFRCDGGGHDQHGERQDLPFSPLPTTTCAIAVTRPTT